MNIFKKSVLVLIGAVIFSCNDPNIIGLEIQPQSDKITIENDSIHHFVINTISEDSLRSDESINLILGKIIGDPVFGVNQGSFVTQIVLPYNNIEAIENYVVDSVFLTYAYSGYYGDLNINGDFDVDIFELDTDILKDNDYYSNFNDHEDFSYINTDISINQTFSNEDSIQPLLNIQLDNSIGEKIMNATGTSSMQDNLSFLDFFKGLYVQASATNTIMYLNPLADKSKFSIFYHEIGGDSAISLDFSVGSETARINIFNNKDSSTLVVPATGQETYIQSMAGYKAEFLFNDIPHIQNMLIDKSINKVTIDFEIIDNMNYPPHEKLYLVRETNEGNIVFLTDFTIEGEEHFGGILNGSTYSFNITRYFSQLLNNPEYTNKLYLLGSGSAANANRTILDNSKISINVIYCEI